MVVYSAGAKTPFTVVPIGSQAKLPSGVRSDFANSCENQLFVPLKSFDCFTSADQLALAHVVGRLGEATRTCAVIELPGASANVEDDERS